MKSYELRNRCFFMRKYLEKEMKPQRSTLGLSKMNAPLYRRNIFNLVEEVNEKWYFTVKMYLAHLMENY